MEFTLETWKKEHIPSVAKYADNEKIAGRLRDSFPYPYTEDDAEWFVQDCMEKEGITQLARAIIVNGEAVGSITVCLTTMYIASRRSWATGLESPSGEKAS